jgi:plasmid stabilization system protein ParE
MPSAGSAARLPEVAVKVVFLEQAAEELELLYDPLYSRVLKKVDLLSRFPDVGAEMFDAFAEYRSLIEPPYRMIYRIIPEKRIEIAFLFHMKRKLVFPV